jgi:hypothetical protein
MDLSGWIAPAVVAAVVSGLASFVGMLVNRSTMIRLQKEDREADLKLADRKFQYERDLHDHKRRVELAEAVLSDFYQCVDVFREIRGPAHMKGEAADRMKEPNETQAEADRLDAYFVPLARMRKNTEFLSNMWSRRHRSRAVLGNAIDEALEKVRDASIRIQVSASTLRDIVRGGGKAAENNKQLILQCGADIWETKDDDPIQPLLQRATEVAETVCRPILERKT